MTDTEDMATMATAFDYAHVRAWAHEQRRHLLATDPRFRQATQVQLRDGSTFYFDSAFAVRIGSAFIVVFSEHHGYHVYDATEVTRTRLYAQDLPVPYADLDMPV